MKGFPNQLAELPKIALGIRCLVDLEAVGENGKDDGVFGEALVRAGVAGTGHVPMNVEDYLKAQLKKPTSGQSFRTTARGLRELYRLMGLIDDSDTFLQTTDLGKAAAKFAGAPWDQSQIAFWRGVINNIEHTDAQGTSHPYQVLLGLVARKPGISRAKCALALEAKNDSPQELERIVKLADLSEDKITAQIAATKANWDNAKKVLPRFAEQLADVIKSKNGTYVLADAPGRAGDVGAASAASSSRTAKKKGSVAPRAPRSSREVTPASIGAAGIADRDEAPLPPVADPAAMAAAIKVRGERLRRHNLIVRALAAILEGAGGKLYEDPFDILALIDETGILVEVKTLDGSQSDERDRVRDALSQLLYYESFLAGAVAGEATIRKIACFESEITDPHREWLNEREIGVVWQADGEFVGDDLASSFLGDLVPEFRE